MITALSRDSSTTNTSLFHFVTSSTKN